MGSVDDYIASLPADAESAEVARLHALICQRVPDLGQTISYGMACYTYRGVPLPDDLIAQLLDIRMRHIDEPSTP